MTRRTGGAKSRLAPARQGGQVADSAPVELHRVRLFTDGAYLMTSVTTGHKLSDYTPR